MHRLRVLPEAQIDRRLMEGRETDTSPSEGPDTVSLWAQYVRDPERRADKVSEQVEAGEKAQGR